MLSQLITVGAGLAVLGVAYLVDLVAALANVFGDSKSDNFSWRKLGKGIARAFLWGFSVVGITLELNLLNWFTTRLGFDTTQALEGVGVVSVLALIVGASIGYAKNTYKNIKNFIECRTPVVELETEGVEPDYDAVAQDVMDFADSITPDWLKGEQSVEMTPEELLEDDNVELVEIGEEEFLFDSAQAADGSEGDILTEEDLDAIYARLDQTGEGLGSATPLSRRLKDGNTDGKNGWQCSRYAYYLGSGVKMLYKAHPDYGPCNGRDMVNYLIKNCGFEKCKKENGAIGCYNNSYYGHTFMIVDAKKNLVNDANYVRPVTVGTHYLPLDSLGCTYCRPKKKTTPQKETGFKKGDKVKIQKAGNSRADGKGATAYGIGLVRYVLAVDKKAKYPYKVGVKTGAVTGYYKENALKKV